MGSTEPSRTTLIVDDSPGRQALDLDRHRRFDLERERFLWLAEQIRDGCLLVDQADEVQYANPQACRYLGIPSGGWQPIARPFLELVRRQYRLEPESAWADWPNVGDGPSPRRRYLVRPGKPTGPAIWLQVTVLSQRDGDSVERLVHLRDVTAQVANQRDMWTFQSMISHKLRSALTEMQMGLELLVDDTNALSPDQVREFARLACAGASHLRDNIFEVLRYVESPIAASNGAGLSLYQLPELVQQIGARLGLPALTISGCDSLPRLETSLSVSAVERVLYELLANARRFHPHREPTIEVVVTPLDDRSVRLTVADDGLTLAPEELEMAFMPYYQGEPYFTGNVGGMGLGLATVASLVWEVGGYCQLYNRPDGPGVVVELILPVATPARPGKAREGDAPGPESSVPERCQEHSITPDPRREPPPVRLI